MAAPYVIAADGIESAKVLAIPCSANCIEAACEVGVRRACVEFNHAVTSRIHVRNGTLPAGFHGGALLVAV